MSTILIRAWRTDAPAGAEPETDIRFATDGPGCGVESREAFCGGDTYCTVGAGVTGEDFQIDKTSNPEEEPPRERGTTSAELADLVAQCRTEIVERYLADLQDSGSVLIAQPDSREQLTVNAEQILDDVVRSLRADRVQVDSRFKIISWEIGVARAAAGVHPQESLDAVSVFFRDALEMVSGLIHTSEQARSQFTVLALALEHSISMRVRESVVAYTSYLLDRVREVQAEERRRIARELHDRIGHGISVTHRQLELYDLYRDTEPQRASAKVGIAQRANLESMENLRAVAADLHPQEARKGLHHALLNFLEIADTEGVAVHLRVSGDEAWAPARVLEETFLILREAARNALNHARARMLAINVDIAPLEIRAFVEDDGIGFEQDDLDRPGRVRGVGLASMYERARALEGTVLIRSGPEKGTRVEFLVPLKRDNGDDLG